MFVQSAIFYLFLLIIMDKRQNSTFLTGIKTIYTYLYIWLSKLLTAINAYQPNQPNTRNIFFFFTFKWQFFLHIFSNVFVSLVLRFRTPIEAHFVENFTLNKKIEKHFIKFLSCHELQVLELNSLFEHFQNVSMRLSEAKE